MRLLVDTQLLIWASTALSALPPAAQTLMSAPNARLTFSSVSIWEVAIKRGLGCGDMPVSARAFHHGLLGAGYSELAVTSEHATAVEGLPMYHRDPFDRILVAQALSEEIALITADRALSRYPGDIRIV